MGNNYGINYPYESFNMGQKFFFFSSLRDKTSLENSTNNKNGADLANEVSGALSQGMSDISQESEQGAILITQVLDFLQKIIEYERGQELTYFKEKFEKADIPQSLKNEFQSLFSSSNGSFNYPQFINLINILYDGVDNYQKLLKYEGDRLRQLNKLIDAYLADDKEHYTRTRENPHADLGFYANFRDYANRTKNYWANDTRTFSNNIQKVIADTITSLWNSTSWITNIENFFNKHFGDKVSQRNVQQLLTINLMNQVMDKIRNAVLNEINNDKQNISKKIINKTVLQDIVRSAATNFLNEINSEENSEASINFLSNLESQITALEKKSLDNNTKRFLKIVDPITYTKRKDGSEIIKIAEDVKNLMIQEIRKKGGKANKNTKNKELIDLFLQKYTNPDDYQLKNNPEEIVQIINKFSASSLPIIDFYIAGKDNIISEAFATGNLEKLGKSPYVISSIGLEGGYQKADVFGIENIPIGAFICSLNNENLKQVAANLTEQITREFFESTEIQPKSSIKDKDFFNEILYRKNHNFGDTEFSIGAETKRRLATLKKMCIEAEEKLKQEGATEEQINTFLKNIKDTIQISTTVKSYDKYQNKEGFHGGSLGGSVENQLQNIYKMYSYGGITLPDIEWMTFAVYNSGANLLGSENKGPIENILSAVAGMLLFDDAGEQALYVKSQTDNFISPGSSKFLHLYYLNDFYFPSSYILSLTYNGLFKAYNLLQDQIGKPTSFLGNFKKESPVNGAKVTIQNNIAEPVLTDQESDWSSFFSANAKGVNINIVFLAGLLDIIDILNSSLKTG